MSPHSVFPEIFENHGRNRIVQLSLVTYLRLLYLVESGDSVGKAHRNDFRIVRSMDFYGITVIYYLFFSHTQSLSAEIFDSIVEQRLLQSFVYHILEQIAFVTLGMTHLAQNLPVAAYYALNGVI